MMLRYYDRAGIAGLFESDVSDFTLVPAADFGRLLRESEGVFTLLNGVLLVLETSSLGATLHVGARSSPLNDLNITVSGDRAGRVLEIHWLRGDVDRFEYVVRGWIEFDPTPGVESEDFDFGLFLRNVRHDAARQRRMCGASDD